MRHPRFHPYASAICVGFAAAAIVFVACAPRSVRKAGFQGSWGSRRFRESQNPAPPAELLFVSDDSTFWVTTGPKGIHVRGAPLTLARYDGRFYELYTADDDRSYDDAVFTGQRVYRRDLETNDSMVVFEDTAVTYAARRYGRHHPGASPLGPDDDMPEDPTLSLTSDVDILDVHGPYLSLAYHAERDGWGDASPMAAGAPTEVVRRLVVDVRTGRRATVADIFGPLEGAQILAAGRQMYATMMDSVRARAMTPDPRVHEALAALPRFPFDPVSFTLTNVDHHLNVAFVVPGRADQSGRVLALPPVAADEPVWWHDERLVRPVSGLGMDSSSDLWSRAPIALEAQQDSVGRVRVVLVDQSHHRWPIRMLGSPVRRVYWLDSPQLDTAARRALVRAFNESALYAEDARAL